MCTLVPDGAPPPPSPFHPFPRSSTIKMDGCGWSVRFVVARSHGWGPGMRSGDERGGRGVLEVGVSACVHSSVKGAISVAREASTPK